MGEFVVLKFKSIERVYDFADYTRLKLILTGFDYENLKKGAKFTIFSLIGCLYFERENVNLCYRESLEC